MDMMTLIDLANRYEAAVRDGDVSALNEARREIHALEGTLNGRGCVLLPDTRVIIPDPAMVLHPAVT